MSKIPDHIYTRGRLARSEAKLSSEVVRTPGGKTEELSPFPGLNKPDR